MLRYAYGELAQKVEERFAATKSDMVRRVVRAQVGPFALSDITAHFPATSRQLIKKVLTAMKKEGEVKLTGRGRGAVW